MRVRYNSVGNTKSKLSAAKYKKKYNHRNSK